MVTEAASCVDCGPPSVDGLMEEQSVLFGLPMWGEGPEAGLGLVCLEVSL